MWVGAVLNQQLTRVGVPGLARREQWGAARVGRRLGRVGAGVEQELRDAGVPLLRRNVQRADAVPRRQLVRGKSFF